MLKESLIECGAIKFGKFVLTSGKESDYYVDLLTNYMLCWSNPLVASYKLYIDFKMY